MAFYPKLGLLGVYGDGSDGDVTISSDITLSRIMMYQNLTIAANTRITMAGFAIFVANQLIFTNSTSIISANGGNGVDGSSGGTGGALAPSSAYGGAVGPAGAGGINNGMGSPGFSAVTSGTLGGNGGSGGAGWNGFSSNFGGAGGTGDNIPNAYGGPNLLHTYPYFFFPHTAATGNTNQNFGGLSGGGGAGDGTVSGGGGGGGAGVVYLFAKKIYGQGRIEAIGGNGGNSG